MPTAGETRPLAAPLRWRVEEFRISGSRQEEREYEGHRARSLEGEWEAVEREAAALNRLFEQGVGGHIGLEVVTVTVGFISHGVDAAVHLRYAEDLQHLVGRQGNNQDVGIGGSATNDGGIGCAQAAGLPVMPLKPKQKIPILADWTAYASNMPSAAVRASSGGQALPEQTTRRRQERSYTVSTRRGRAERRGGSGAACE